MIKHVIIAAVALLAGGVIAHFHVAAQSYRPIVRVQAPDGVTYTAVLDAKHERPACGAASERFLTPFKADCPDCRVVFARCRREGDGLPAVASDMAKEGPLVLMPGVSMRIDAPEEKARSTCQWVAESVHRLGVPGARCVTSALEPKT